MKSLNDRSIDREMRRDQEHWARQEIDRLVPTYVVDTLKRELFRVLIRSVLIAFNVGVLLGGLATAVFG